LSLPTPSNTKRDPEPGSVLELKLNALAPDERFPRPVISYPAVRR
jgi:hypothetical protein